MKSKTIDLPTPAEIKVLGIFIKHELICEDWTSSDYESEIKSLFSKGYIAARHGAYYLIDPVLDSQFDLCWYLPI
jgi:hypothetical protein